MAKATKEAPQEKTTVQPVDFPDVSQEGPVSSVNQFDILLDLNVEVSVVLGKTDIAVKKLMQLGPGAVLELDKSIEAPVDLYLQGTKFADGDVVVVDNCFAIRIKNIAGMDNIPAETPS